MREKPIRVQLSRRKGWRMPANTVKVDRTTKWGNPFIVGKHGTREECVRFFTLMLGGYVCISQGDINEQIAYRKMVATDKAELKGKNLACWCPAGAACHADVLLGLKRGAKGRARP